MRFIPISLIIGAVHSSINSTLWKPYNPAAITTPVTIQIHKRSLSNQVPIHSWVKRVYIKVKCLIQGHSATPRQPRPVPKTFQSIVTAPWRPACIWSLFFFLRYIGSLMVDTARSLSSSVVLLHPTQCQWDGSAIYVVMLSTRDTQSPLLKGKNKSLQASPPHDGDWTRGRRVTGANATTCAIAPFCCPLEWSWRLQMCWLWLSSPLITPMLSRRV